MKKKKKCYIDAFFFKTTHSISGQFPGGAKDTPKSGPSSDLDPSFSCWEAFPGFPWSANINEGHENPLNEAFFKASFRTCRKLTRGRCVVLKKASIWGTLKHGWKPLRAH